MLVVSRFSDVPADFAELAGTALDVLATRPGFVRGRLGRDADDGASWVLVTEWIGVGAYRRALSAYEVKVHAAPLLALGRDEASAFEVLADRDAQGLRTAASDRSEPGTAAAAGPGRVGPARLG